MGIPGRLPLVVELDGEDVELGGDVEPLEMVEALAGGSWWAVLELIDSGLVLRRRVADYRDTFNLATARTITLSAVETATGYRWFTACSLAASAVGSWSEFDGLCAYRGFDPWNAPVGRTLAMVHHCLLAGCKDETERGLLAYRLSGAEAADRAAAAGVAGPLGGFDDSEMGRMEAAAAAEWAAAFSAEGELLNPGGLTMPN